MSNNNKDEVIRDDGELTTTYDKYSHQKFNDHMDKLISIHHSKIIRDRKPNIIECNYIFEIEEIDLIEGNYNEIKEKLTADLFDKITTKLRVIYPKLFELLDYNVLTLDTHKRKFILNGKELKLTKHENSIMHFLMKNRGRVVTHEEILEAVWGQKNSKELNNSAGYFHYVRIYISQLRKKIEDYPKYPKLIISEQGVGYRLVN